MILIVDDDPRILAMTRDALIKSGHDVISCESGAQALQALAEDEAIELLLTDVLMPGMKGTELVRLALKVRTDLRVLFMSGDVGDTRPEEFSGHALLPKPFTAQALNSAVAAALN